MPHTPQKRTEATYHPYAECADCDYQTDSSRLARDWAKAHVRATGHSVRVIVEKVALWGPR